MALDGPSGVYSERLWPGPLGWALVPAAGLVTGVILLPVHPVVALVGALGATLVALVVAVAASPAVTVRDGELRVGAAHVPVALLGAPTVLDGDGVRAALGPGSDARTYVRLRAWIPGAVHVPVLDPADPTPAWLVSSRHPAALASAIEAQAAHSVQTR